MNQNKNANFNLQQVFLFLFCIRKIHINYNYLPGRIIMIGKMLFIDTINIQTGVNFC